VRPAYLGAIDRVHIDAYTDDEAIGVLRSGGRVQRLVDASPGAARAQPRALRPPPRHLPPGRCAPASPTPLADLHLTQETSDAPQVHPPALPRLRPAPRAVPVRHVAGARPGDRFVVVQHNRERNKPTSTGRVAAAVLRAPIIYYGAQGEAMDAATLEDPDTRLLRAVPVARRACEVDATTRPAAGKQRCFVILDGTWHQCSRMARRAPRVASCRTCPPAGPAVALGRAHAAAPRGAVHLRGRPVSSRSARRRGRRADDGLLRRAQRPHAGDARPPPEQRR
jgi:hypothetical protein